jgi:ABC-type sugar transport system substrate-binding protein
MPLAGALALTAVLAALGAGIAMADPAPAAHDATARRALLMPVGSNPFRVRGSGFRAREAVRVTITPTGKRGITRRVRASGRGTFTLAFAGIDSCGGVHGVAAGARGSRASFQFSSIMC